MIKTHTFNGVKHDIDLEHNVAYCDNPTPCNENPVLYVPMDKHKGSELLYLFVHEACHACNFKASEDRVEKTSKDIARFLWRLGYRLK